MIVVMNPQATQGQVERVVDKVRQAGLQVHISEGEERTIIGCIGDVRKLMVHQLEVLPGVDRVVRIIHPFKLSSKTFKPEATLVEVGKVLIGGKRLCVMAGPCAVESREMLLQVARELKNAKTSVLRGGAFKPRTSPYSFQGLGEEGLRILAEAKSVTSLPIVTEVMNPGDVELVARYADILQVGARNMQNFGLLQELGAAKVPVLLKRGMMSTVEELLMSAEYILSKGNSRVILCERGIRTFETYTRNTLDLSSVPLLKSLSHLPVIVDPSHATGRRDLVPAMSRAAIAAGADGLIIEVHPNPQEALSDGPQSLTPDEFSRLMVDLIKVAEAIDREL